MAEGEFPVTIDMDGEKVVVGSAKLIQRPDKNGEATVSVTLDTDSLVGSRVHSMITEGVTRGLSIGTSEAQIINTEDLKEINLDGKD